MRRNGFDSFGDNAVVSLLEGICGLPEYCHPSRYGGAESTATVHVEGVGVCRLRLNMNALRGAVTRTRVGSTSTLLFTQWQIVQERRVYLALNEHGVPLAAPVLKVELRRAEQSLQLTVSDAKRLLEDIVIEVDIGPSDGGSGGGDAEPPDDPPLSADESGSASLPRTLPSPPGATTEPSIESVVTSLERDPALANYPAAHLATVRVWWRWSCHPDLARRPKQQTAFRAMIVMCALFGNEFPLRTQEWIDVKGMRDASVEARRRAPGVHEIAAIGLVALSRFAGIWSLFFGKPPPPISKGSASDWFKLTDRFRKNYQLALDVLGSDPESPSVFRSSGSLPPRARPVAAGGLDDVGLNHRRPE